MIPKGCRRLAEVDFPIAAVSRHAAREKSIRHGHPSTLHLWWARRPLASCRAMLLALLLPDPGDPRCPETFTEEARRLLPAVVGPVAAPAADLRRKLLRFIADFANWDVGRQSDLSEGRPRPGPRRPRRGNAAGGGPVRRRWLHSAGGAAARLRDVRQRPESGRLPDPQGDAGGHSASRAGAGGRPAHDRRRDQDRGAAGVGRPVSRGPGRGDADCLPVGARCAARRPAAGRRFRCCARSGCARSRGASGRCA